MQKIDTILISHSHEDHLYASELVKIIKVTGIEQEGVRIICSSYPGHAIPGDELIYDFLREEIKGDIWVIYLLSQNYYNSPGCLNEMGAAWVLQKKYSTFLVPHFKFSDMKGAIDPSKNAFQLSKQTALNDFKNLILSSFDLQVDDNIWESVRDTALKCFIEEAREREKKNQLTTIAFETVRKGKNQTNTEVVFRVKNLNNYHVILNYCETVLQDIDGNEHVAILEPDNAIVYSGESKLLFISLVDSTSPYSMNKHIKGKIERHIFQTYYEGS